MDELDMTTVQDLQQHLRAFALSQPLVVKVGDAVMLAAEIERDDDDNVVLTLKAD